MKSKDPLGVSIGSILRPKMQWIQYVNTQKVYIYIYGIDDSTIAADFWIGSDAVFAADFWIDQQQRSFGCRFPESTATQFSLSISESAVALPISWIDGDVVFAADF